MVALALLLACGSALVWAAKKGPDGGGYMATDDTVYSFVDISGASGGTSLLSGTDDGTAVLGLPFPFRFYGQPYTLACVSTNGALYFVPSEGECSGFGGDFANTDITAAPVPNDRPAILPFWSDLTFQEPGAGAVLYQTLGDPPNRRFVVQWNRVYPQGSPNPVTFQVVFTEATARLVFQYQTVELGDGNAAHGGAQATVGIRNSGGAGNSQRLLWSHRVPVIRDQSALQFTAGDTTPPVITAVATPATLWPPNGKTVKVRLQGIVRDDGSGLDRTSVRYSVSDGYGIVQPSGAITLAADGSYSIEIPLTADRHGEDRDGRRYTITVRAKNLSGNEAIATAVVTVPHDQGK